LASCRDEQNLSTCASGWVYAIDDQPCEGARLAGKPEASQPDCLERNLFGFLPDGTEYEMIVAYSPSLGTMSTVGDIATRRYSLAASSITFSPPGGERGSGPASCTSEGNLKISYASFTKASPSWAAALNAQVQSGRASWTAVAVTR
jgi:hypothetical protein